MPSTSKRDAAGDVFATVVADHVRRIQQRVPPALADEPDAVHRLRTAVRRLRTVLAVYRPVFDRDEVAALRERLSGFGDVLGAARDLEVRWGDVESIGREARVARRARQHLVDDLADQHDKAHARLVEWCNGPEFEALTAELVRWVAAPPLGAASTRSARTVARRRLDRAVRRVRRAAADVDLVRLQGADGDELADLLPRAHRLRKAGRRLSQATRAVTRPPAKVLGRPARDLGALGKQLQSSLGDHRDAMLLAAHVSAVASSVADDGGDRAPYDRLARAADRRGRERLDAAAEAVAALDDGR